MKSIELSSKILEELKKGDIVTGCRLSDKYDISRTAVWKKINNLKSEGYDIRSIPRKGYFLKGRKECFSPEEIYSEIKTKSFGKDIHFYERAGSTNDLAYQYALKNNEEGAVFIAELQTKGRGRLGREWFSPKGKGLWFTLIIRPKFNISEITIMPLLTAVSCAKAINDMLGLNVKIKWPNDLMINNKKVGGILLEMKAEIDKINFLIIGIGIDVNLSERDIPEYLKNKAGSLKIAAGDKISRVKLLVNILENLEKMYYKYPGNKIDIIRTYSEKCCNLGSMINIETQAGIIKGKAIEIDENGCLILEDKSGKLLKLTSGDIIG